MHTKNTINMNPAGQSSFQVPPTDYILFMSFVEYGND